MTTNNDTPTPPRGTRPAPPVATLQTHGTANVRRTDKPPQPTPANGGGRETPAPEILRVLLLEADRGRGDQVRDRLARAERKSDVVRAESVDEFFTLLGQFQFDCLLVGALPEGSDFGRFVEQTRERCATAGLVFLSDAAHSGALAQAVQSGQCGVVEPKDDEIALTETLIRARQFAAVSGATTVETGQLTETEERFRQIAHSMHQGFWVSRTSDGRLISMNSHFLELSGGAPMPGTGGARRFIDVVHPEDQEAVARVLDLDAPRREFEFECRIEQPGGGVRWTKTHGFPIRDAGGECVRIVGITEDTTDERKLRRESEQLATLLAAFPDTCLLVHADGSVGDVQLNGDAGLITPPPPGVAATLVHLLPSGPAGLVGRSVADCAADGLPRSVEFPHERAGTRRQYEARVRGAGGGRCLVLIREIAAAPQTHPPANSGGQWAALVDTLPVILFIQHRVGEWGTCLFSDGCDRLTGFPPGQLDGGELPVLSPIMHWEDVEPARAEVELADWEKRPYEIEYRIRTAGGGERCFREHGHALRDDFGEIIGHEGFILDITAEQQLGAQLSELVSRLGTPAASLVNGLRAPESDERLHTIEAAFRGLLHHFNSALMRIRGGCDALTAQLRRGTASADGAGTLSLIRNASGETSRMLRQLGEVILAEKAPLTTQPLDLNWVAQEAIAQAVLRHGASDPRSLNIHARFNPLPPHEGSAGVILNALTALFSSMLSANTGDGRILVETTSTLGESIMEIRLESAPEAETGDGESLRDAFAQFTGLMELQGAVVEESAAGAGLRVRLPNPVEDDPSNTAFHHAPGAARRILIVDDEPLIVEILREYLTGDGHEVVTAATGDEALVNIDAGGFDLVLTDRSMPGISGDQLAETIHQRNPELPVVMVTGMCDLMRANGEKPEHCRMVLGKPVSQASLRAALLQAVAN